MYKILVVDDDKITHAFINRALINDFYLTKAFSGEEAIRSVATDKPDLILLDVEMPGLNGYAVCELIKADPKTTDIPVIFLSAREELRDRMQGFEAGADDYIVKPFQPETLMARINVILGYKQEQFNLMQQVEDARKTAVIAIAGSSDLGQAIQFVESTHSVLNHEQLARALCRVTNSMGLNCSILIESNAGNQHFSSNFKPVSPLEVGLMRNLREAERFFDFGCRTQINYPHISILIKNMPLDNMERYGRIKDILPAMLSTADIKVNQLNAMLAMTEQLTETKTCFLSITKTLEGINTLSQRQQKAGIKIMRNMLMELDGKLPSMALDDDQEQYILSRVDSAIDEAHTVIFNTHDNNKAFSSVIDQLRELITSQQNIHDQMHAVKEPMLPNNSAIGYEMDVELF